MISALRTIFAIITAVNGQQPLSGPGLSDITTGGYWDGDLGVPLPIIGDNTSFWLLEGDILGSVDHARIPNAIARAKLMAPARNLAVHWHLAANGLPIEIFPLRAKSSVPAGGLALASSQQYFLFMMNVSDWRDGAPGNVNANGFLAQVCPFIFVDRSPIITS